MDTYKSHIVPHRFCGEVFPKNIMRMINTCEANEIAMTKESYLCKGSILSPYEKLCLISVTFDFTLDDNVWYFLKDGIPKGKMIFTCRRGI